MFGHSRWHFLTLKHSVFSGIGSYLSLGIWYTYIQLMAGSVELFNIVVGRQQCRYFNLYYV